MCVRNGMGMLLDILQSNFLKFKSQSFKRVFNIGMTNLCSYQILKYLLATPLMTFGPRFLTTLALVMAGSQLGSTVTVISPSKNDCFTTMRAKV